MQFSPAAAQAVIIPLWASYNAYNIVTVSASSADGTASWVYGTAAWLLPIIRLELGLMVGVSCRTASQRNVLGRDRASPLAHAARRREASGLTRARPWTINNNYVLRVFRGQLHEVWFSAHRGADRAGVASVSQQLFAWAGQLALPSEVVCESKLSFVPIVAAASLRSLRSSAACRAAERAVEIPCCECECLSPSWRSVYPRDLLLWLLGSRRRP
jgi:hypothetical protein